MKNTISFSAILFLLGVNLMGQGPEAMSYNGMDTVIFSNVENDSKNVDYLINAMEKGQAKDVSNWQSKIANFKINELSIFTKKERSKYHVAFKNKRAKLNIDYDHEGNVLYAQEDYQNIKLPKEVLKRLPKDLKDWRIEKTQYRIIYVMGKASKKSYKVTLFKGNQRKTVKLK